MSVYGLVVAKNGPKLIEVHDPARSESRRTSGQFTATAARMESLAVSLTPAAGRPVIDITGLTGRYKVDLKWTPGYDQDGDGRRIDHGILSILGEQLGLKLEPRKAPVEIMVIYRAGKIPTPN